MSAILLRNRSASYHGARHRLWPLAALLSFLLLAACTSPEEKEAQHLKNGIALIEQGDDQRAMVELRNVLQINPKNADAIYQMGLIHEREGRFPQAYAAYQQAAAERPDFIAAQAKFGTLALVADNLQAAANAADAIEKIDSRNPDGLAIRGVLALRSGDTEEALNLANQALQTSPQHESAVMVVASVYHQLGETPRAIARLDEAIAANPESLSLRLLKITLLEQADDVDVEAIAATYRELMALQPEEAFYPLALSDFYRRSGDVAGGESVLRTAIHSGLKEPQAVEGLIRLIQREKGFDAAAAELEALIERDPDNHELRFMLADLYAAEERPEDAERVLDEVILRVETGTVAEDARAAMARIRLAAGDADGARTLAEDVLTRDQHHRDANLVLARIFLEDGRYNDAIQSTRSALRQDETWLPGLRLLADIHLRTGETNLAYEALRKIVDLDPNDANSAGRLARLLTEQGDVEAALKLWDHVVRVSQNPAGALRARAQIEMGRGNWSAALADVQHLLNTPGQEVTGNLLAGRLALLQKQHDDAREWFERAQSLDPSAVGPTIATVGSYVSDDDLDGALAYLQERTRTAPDDAVAFNLMGQLLLRQDRSADAEAAFRRAIELEPPWPTPYQELAQMLMAAGNVDGAVEVYQSALTRWPDDPDVLMAVASGYRVAGRFDEAIDTYAQVNELHPEIDLAANNYAALVAEHQYADAGRLKRALDVADRFRTSDNGYFLDTLGWLHYRNGDFAAATSYLERAASLISDNPEIRYHLGMALHRNGQEERAIEELEKAVVDDVNYPGLDEARTLYQELQRSKPARADSDSGADGST